jgi:hypothetical protein
MSDRSLSSFHGALKKYRTRRWAWKYKKNRRRSPTEKS